MKRYIFVALAMTSLVGCESKTEENSSVQARHGDNTGVAKKYSCGNVGGIEEWNLRIDLNKNLASFFDNDTEVKVALKKVVSIETLPPQMLYTFEGRDTTGAEGDKIRIEFNQTTLTGSVTLKIGGAAQETLDAKDNCKIDNSIEL